MGEQEMFLRSIQDLEAIEHVPLAARLSVRNTYELIREAATQDPERTAIAFLSYQVANRETILASGKRIDSIG